MSLIINEFSLDRMILGGTAVGGLYRLSFLKGNSFRADWIAQLA